MEAYEKKDTICISWIGHDDADLGDYIVKADEIESHKLKLEITQAVI